MHEEGQAEDSVDDRGNRGEVLDVDLDEAVVPAVAIGETAPLILVGAATFVAFNPTGLDSGFTALPLQIFNWISQPQAEFKLLAAAGILVLLSMLLAMNAMAIWLRNKYERKW